MHFPQLKENAMKNLIVHIDGMNCGSCVNGVHSALSALDGVAQVRVDLANNQAVIDLDEGLVSDAQIVKAIEDAGFDAHL